MANVSHIGTTLHLEAHTLHLVKPSISTMSTTSASVVSVAAQPPVPPPGTATTTATVAVTAPAAPATVPVPAAAAEQQEAPATLDAQDVLQLLVSSSSYSAGDGHYGSGDAEEGEWDEHDDTGAWDEEDEEEYYGHVQSGYHCVFSLATVLRTTVLTALAHTRVMFVHHGQR